jgi:hypothetical protein
MTAVVVLAICAVIGMLVLGVLAVVYGVKSGKLEGRLLVLESDAQRHALDLQSINAQHSSTLKRYQTVLAAKKEDLKIARDELDKIKIAVAEGRTDDALKVGASLRDWLVAADAASDDFLLEIPVEPPGDEGGDQNGDSPGGGGEAVPGGAATEARNG